MLIFCRLIVQLKIQCWQIFCTGMPLSGIHIGIVEYKQIFLICGWVKQCCLIHGYCLCIWYLVVEWEDPTFAPRSSRTHQLFEQACRSIVSNDTSIAFFSWIHNFHVRWPGDQRRRVVGLIAKTKWTHGSALDLLVFDSKFAHLDHAAMPLPLSSVGMVEMPIQVGPTGSNITRAEWDAGSGKKGWTASGEILFHLTFQYKQDCMHAKVWC